MKPTKPGVPSADTQAVSTGIALESILRALYSTRAPGEVQPLQWSILRYLGRCTLRHATVADVSRFVNVSHAPVSRALATLCTKGLVVATEHPTEKRRRAYKVTERGAEHLAADPFLRLQHTLDGLSPTERQSFLASVRKILLDISK